MSVSETLKTRTGIKKFILPTGSEENAVLAFEYVDKKTEVHLLKRECAPLYLEENTVVALISDEQVGSFLLAITPSAKQGKGCCLTFKFWDSASILGFTPKEIQIQDAERSIIQDGKFRSTLTLAGTADISTMRLESLSTMVALILENEVLIWKAVKKDSNALTLQFYNSIKIRGSSDFILVEKSGQHSVIIAENGCLSVWSLSDSGVLVSKSVSIPPKPNGTVTLPQNLQRISRSNIMFTDDDGRLWRYSLESNLVSNVRLPGLPNGCNVYSICNKSKTNQGLLAVCTDGHTINLYSSVGIMDNPSKGTIVYPRPFKILFSTVSINAMVFSRDDTLALASTSNRTLTIWTGILQSA